MKARRRAPRRRHRRHVARLRDGLRARAQRAARRSASTRRSSRTSWRSCRRSPSRPGSRWSAILATHADWDHLLGRYAFPEAPLGAGETTAARLINEPGDAQRRMRAFDDEFYVTRPKPLSLSGSQQLPVPGHVDVGERSLELQPADGHTADGMAIWVPWARVLIAGDYLSPVEIPMISRERLGHRLPGDAEPARAARRAGRPRRARPRRPDRRHARGRDPARGPRLPGGAGSSTAPTRRCRSRGARTRSARSTTRNVTRAMTALTHRRRRRVARRRRRAAAPSSRVRRRRRERDDRRAGGEVATGHERAGLDGPASGLRREGHAPRLRASLRRD